MALTVRKAKLKTNFDYTPISQMLEDVPFVVQFEALKLDELAELQDSAIKVGKDGEYSISLNTLNYSVIKQTLTGWKNVESDDGPIRFKRDNNGATESTLALIPADIRAEIATIIIEVSKDLPNAEEYLSELASLAKEDEEEDEVAEAKPARKPRTKKA